MTAYSREEYLSTEPKSSGLSTSSHPRSKYPAFVAFIRHAHSESNAFIEHSRDSKHDLDYVNDRVEYKHRLDQLGVGQAQAIGKKISKIFPRGLDSFDALITSPYIRACETAAHLTNACDSIMKYWSTDYRLSERSWGDYTPYDTGYTDQSHAYQRKLEKESYFLFHPNGGEGLHTASLRITNFLSDWAGQTVLAVTHCDLMLIAMLTIENLLPEEFDALASSHGNTSTETIRNGTILTYRFMLDHIERCIYHLDDPDNHIVIPEQISYRRTFEPSELLLRAEAYPRLIT